MSNVRQLLSVDWPEKNELPVKKPSPEAPADVLDPLAVAAPAARQEKPRTWKGG